MICDRVLNWPSLSAPFLQTKELRYMETPYRQKSEAQLGSQSRSSLKSSPFSSDAYGVLNKMRALYLA